MKKRDRFRPFKTFFSLKNLKFWQTQVQTALAPWTDKTSSGVFKPLSMIVAALMTILTLGTALGAFFTLFASLLLLYFITTEVFGIHFDLGDIVEV